MEFSLHINQRRAVEWDLSLGEAVLFGYLTTVGQWAKHAPDGSGYFWLSPAKLQAELPLVCSHKDSARRHMRNLQAKGLVERRKIGNDAYFRVTAKGVEWRSNTIAESPDESVRSSDDLRTDRSAAPDESVRSSAPTPDQSVRQSDTPVKSSNQNQEKKCGREPRARPASDGSLPEELEAAYRERIPWGVQFQVWPKKRQQALRRLQREHPFCLNAGFWDAYFAAAATDRFIRGEVPPRPGSDPFRVGIDYLLREEVFTTIVERQIDAEERRASA